MSFYSNLINKISGDTLVIVAPSPFEKTRGLYELVDWKLGGVLSRTVVEQARANITEKPILVPSNGKLPVERIVLIPLNKNTKSEILKSLRGLISRDCTISFPRDFKKDLKAYFFEEFKTSDVEWQRIVQRPTDDEILIVLTKIQYN